MKTLWSRLKRGFHIQMERSGVENAVSCANRVARNGHGWSVWSLKGCTAIARSPEFVFSFN